MGRSPWKVGPVTGCEPVLEPGLPLWWSWDATLPDTDHTELSLRQSSPASFLGGGTTWPEQSRDDWASIQLEKGACYLWQGFQLVRSLGLCLQGWWGWVSRAWLIARWFSSDLWQCRREDFRGSQFPLHYSWEPSDFLVSLGLACALPPQSAPCQQFKFSPSC